MEIGLKERLIGAVVLVILAVIIIPWVLKGSSVPSTTVTRQIALPAATSTLPQTYRMDLNHPAAAAQSVASLSSVSVPPPVTTRAAVTGAAPAANPPANPAVARAAAPVRKSVQRPASLPATPAIAPGQWVVQAGSYGNESNARSVQRKLAAHGYHAYISRFHTPGRTYYRVRVGPYADRAAAERILPEIARTFGGRAVVVPNS